MITSRRLKPKVAYWDRPRNLSGGRIPAKSRHIYYFLIDFIGFLACEMNTIEGLGTECKA